MCITHIENYLSLDAYAELCKVSRRSIQNRIQVGSVSAILVDGHYFVNVEDNPPKKFAHGKFRTEKAVDETTYSNLRAVIPWANARNIRSYRFLREIVTGKRNAWVIGGEVFCDTDDLFAYYGIR